MNFLLALESRCRLETLLNLVERPELFNPLSIYLNPDSNFITRRPNSGYWLGKT